MKITIEREFTTIEAGDIAITAAEGGIGYWASVAEYSYLRWSQLPVPEDFVFYTLRGTEDDGFSFDGEEFAITPTLIRRGIQLYLSGVPGHFAGRQFDDMDDLSAMDADEADLVIQLGCFGAHIYG